MKVRNIADDWLVVNNFVYVIDGDSLRYTWHDNLLVFCVDHYVLKRCHWLPKFERCFRCIHYRSLVQSRYVMAMWSPPSDKIKRIIVVASGFNIIEFLLLVVFELLFVLNQLIVTRSRSKIINLWGFDQRDVRVLLVLELAGSVDLWNEIFAKKLVYRRKCMMAELGSNPVTIQ